MLELREGRRCHSEAVAAVNVGLACVDAVIAFLALYKLIRIHSRSTQLGWTRQKVIHLLIGSSNLGHFLYFVLNLVAACKGWICWSYSCGFVFMAFPRILFIAAFLLLLSFWVDLCHHPNDDEEDEGYNPQEALLEKMNKTNAHTNGHRRCCTFRSARIGSRQKIVILVTVLVFAIMIASSVLIWIGMGNSPIQPAIVAQVYVDIIAVIVLLLGGALACYGVVLFLKMKKVKSEQASSEMWKVAGLAVVSVICFTSSASIAIGTHIPLFYDWDEQRHMDAVRTSLLLFVYYFIGSLVPSAVVLYLMRELPPPLMSNNRREESTTITFIHDDSVTATQRQCWTRATSVQNQVLMLMPVLFSLPPSLSNPNELVDAYNNGLIVVPSVFNCSLQVLVWNGMNAGIKSKPHMNEVESWNSTCASRVLQNLENGLGFSSGPEENAEKQGLEGSMRRYSRKTALYEFDSSLSLSLYIAAPFYNFLLKIIFSG